jgi:signal transduction histidine kinase
LLNLIGNAVKHHDRAQGRVQVRCGVRGDAYVFSVADDGPGIPAEYHQRVFQMFQTLRPRDAVEGSGMGLALVRRIVEGGNGSVWVEPNAPRGSVFRFTWPHAMSGRPSFPPLEETATSAGGGDS